MDIPKPTSNKRRRNKKVKRYNIKKTIISVIIIVALAFTVSVVFRNNLFGNDKYILGFRSFITLSDSMGPHIQKGSLIITRRVNADSIQKGDIITYTEGSDILTQRVAEITDNNGVITFITMGDAYEGVNSKPISSDALIGKLVFSVSNVGNAILAIRNPIYLSLCVAGSCVCFFVFDILHQRYRKRKLKRKRNKGSLRGNKIKMNANNWQRVTRDLNNMELVIPKADGE